MNDIKEVQQLSGNNFLGHIDSDGNLSIDINDGRSFTANISTISRLIQEAMPKEIFKKTFKSRQFVADILVIKYYDIVPRLKAVKCPDGKDKIERVYINQYKIEAVFNGEPLTHVLADECEDFNENKRNIEVSINVVKNTLLDYLNENYMFDEKSYMVDAFISMGFNQVKP